MNLRAILLIFIGLHCSSKAVNLQINEELTLRIGSNSEGENYTGQPVGILPKGSIVDIPDQYIVRDSSGKVDIDFTLNKWFEKGGLYFKMNNGLNVFHTPIDVIHPKLDPALSGKKIHVALQNLKLKNTSTTTMNVIEDSELLSVLEAPAETEAGSICSGVCALSHENLDKNTQDFITKMREFRETVIPTEVIDKTTTNIERLKRDVHLFDSILQSRCAISQAQLAVEVEKMIQENDFPFNCNELMGLVFLESAGRCRALNRNDNRDNTKVTIDLGLFQINSFNYKNDVKAGRAKICTDTEFEEYKEKAKKSEDPIAFWKAQPEPQCISNPMYSLKKATRILIDNKNYFRRYRDDHPDLYRRFMISGYNGGMQNIDYALQDLELYNNDLQKKLEEGGKDITKSNRGVRRIKEEIRTIDNGITSVSQSLRSLNSDIRQIEQVLERVNRIFSQTEQLTQDKTETKERREQELQDIQDPIRKQIARRSQQAYPAVQRQVRMKEEALVPLVREWNTLNEQEVSAITQQQRILSFLDRNLRNITDERRTTDPLSREGKILALRGAALERFISEVEEEKWPYFMDSLLKIPAQTEEQTVVAQDRTPQPPPATQPVERSPKPKTETVQVIRPYRPPPKSMVDKMKEYKDGVFDFVNVHGENLGSMMRDMRTKITTAVTGSDKNPQWDFYQIHALEQQLKAKHNLVRRRGPQRTDSALMTEISEIQSKISSAKQQRKQDIENILNRNYRNQMSPEEKARALKIIESEIETMAWSTNQELDKQLDDWTTLQEFFYPSSIMERFSRIDQLEDVQHEIINENTQKPKRGPASTDSPTRGPASEGISTAQRETRPVRAFPQPNLGSSTSRSSKNFNEVIDPENESIRYLFSIMARKPMGSRPHSTYLSDLQALETSRTRIDKRRQDLAENDSFQEIKPFLGEEKNRENGTTSLVIGARARLFYREQARTTYNRRNLQRDIRDISRLSTVSNLTQAEVRTLQEQIQNLTSELNNLRTEKQQQEQQIHILLTDQIEKLDQEDILQKQLEQAQADLATSKKDPYDWEDIKLFYFASEFKKTIEKPCKKDEGTGEGEDEPCEKSGLKSTRSKANAKTNIAYIDGLLGTKNQPGFMQTDEAKHLCRQPQ